MGQVGPGWARFGQVGPGLVRFGQVVCAAITLAAWRAVVRPDAAVVLAAALDKATTARDPELACDLHLDLSGALEEMINSDGPYLLNVQVPYQEHVLPMIPSGHTVDDIAAQGACQLCGATKITQSGQAWRIAGISAS